MEGDENGVGVATCSVGACSCTDMENVSEGTTTEGCRKKAEEGANLSSKLTTRDPDWLGVGRGVDVASVAVVATDGKTSGEVTSGDGCNWIVTKRLSSELKNNDSDWLGVGRGVNVDLTTTPLVACTDGTSMASDMDSAATAVLNVLVTVT